MKEFSWPIRVYYEDTDAAGVVYHSNYLKFMERARTEWLRAIGFSQNTMRRENNAIIVISELDMKFIKPAKLDDLLDVKSTLVRTTGASFLFDQTIEKSQEKRGNLKPYHRLSNDQIAVGLPFVPLDHFNNPDHSRVTASLLFSKDYKINH